MSYQALWRRGVGGLKMLTAGGRSRKPRAIVFNLNFERKVILSGHSIVVTVGPPEVGDW